MTRFAPALQVRDFSLWFCASFGMSVALQMLEVIIGWSVYSHQHSALDLGWIGLAEFIPLFVPRSASRRSPPPACTPRRLP